MKSVTQLTSSVMHAYKPSATLMNLACFRWFQNESFEKKGRWRDRPEVRGYLLFCVSCIISDVIKLTFQVKVVQMFIPVFHTENTVDSFPVMVTF